MKTILERKIYKASLSLWGILFLAIIFYLSELIMYFDPIQVYMALCFHMALIVPFDLWSKKIDLKENLQRDAFKGFYNEWKIKTKGQFGEGYDLDVEKSSEDCRNEWHKYLKDNPQIPR